MHWFHFLEKRSNFKLSKPLNDMKNLIQEKGIHWKCSFVNRWLAPMGAEGGFPLKWKEAKPLMAK